MTMIATTGAGTAGGQDAPTVEQWRIVEIAFESGRDYADPCRDVRLDVTFTQGERRIARPAFWDGGNVWKVRFAPPAVGTWQYATACSDADNPALHGRTGRVRCVSYTGKNPLYRHGFLRVSDDRRRLSHADGTPFFWLGDTHWMGIERESVDTCDHPDHRGGPCPYGGTFQHIVQDRKAKGFNVYQTYPRTQDPRYWTDGDDQLNPAAFGETFDVMMDYLAEEGFVIALGLGHHSAPKSVALDDLKLFARYIVARYGAHPVVWITSQESDMFEDTAPAWKAVAAEIARLDGYPQPLSYHQKWGPHTTWWNEPWHQWGCTQGGHKHVGLRSKDDYRTFWDFRPTRPWLEAEHMYEGLTAGGGPHSDTDARQAAWKSILCGSFGYTYGGAGIWLLGRNAEEIVGSRWLDLVWFDGLDLPGATQMGHLKRFFLALDDWHRLTPRWSDPAWGKWAHDEETIVASVDHRVFVVYFYADDTATGTLAGLDGARTYAACWFDPREGTRTPIGESIHPADGTWAVPKRPDARDWVLLVERAAAEE